MTVLLWPRCKQEKHLNNVGIVVGWNHDSNTVICAKILHHKDYIFLRKIIRPDQQTGDLRILGKWIPRKEKVESWLSSDEMAEFTLTPLGPWWANELRDSNDLLIYYDPEQNYNFRLERSYQKGFSCLLKRLHAVEQLHCLQYDCQEEENDENQHQCSAEYSSALERRASPHVILQNSLLHKHLTETNRISLHYFFNNNLSKDLPSMRSHYAVYLDSFLGVLVGATILIYRKSLSKILSVAIGVQYQTLQDAIEWLESFPIGFKLNEPLTHSMGKQLHIIFYCWNNIILGLGDCLGHNNFIFWWMFTGLGSISFLFGATTFFAILVDLIQVGTLHLIFLHAFFNELYRFELYMLVSLWQVYRGKKFNPLRKRTDTMEYDSMQLLIGMLLFAFSLFLFTTILVYYVFYTLLYIVVQPIGLWLVYGFLRDFPFDGLWNRWRDPSAMGVGIYFDKEPAHATRLCVIPMSYKKLLAPFTERYLKRIFFIFLDILKGIGTKKRLNIIQSCIKD
mmetsp:Transcript_13570/g.20987  ORF Transcript_13570/g.20987 Transcript_13570/m.20987 type:complete len:508 (+) Transcript_13570:191-1714(+)